MCIGLFLVIFLCTCINIYIHIVEQIQNLGDIGPSGSTQFFFPTHQGANAGVLAKSRFLKVAKVKERF